MLVPVARAAGWAAERWADEDAAHVVGDRRLVARALARAALHLHDTARPPGAGAPGAALGALHGAVLTRVQALLAGPPRRHTLATVTLTALSLATLTWAGGVRDRADDFFDAAHTHPAVRYASAVRAAPATGPARPGTTAGGGAVGSFVGGEAVAMADGTQRRPAGALEAAVLRALRYAGVPLTPAEIQARLDPGLAYNTVHTVLTRLCDKGVLSRTRRAGRTAYQPTQDYLEQDVAQLRALLDNAPDSGALLRRFVDTLTPGEEAALRALLRDDG
jgi:predicted transcriptional regulator